MECMTEKVSERGNTMTEKKTEWGEVLEGPPRVWSITQPTTPAIPLPFEDDTLKCCVPSLG